MARLLGLVRQKVSPYYRSIKLSFKRMIRRAHRIPYKELHCVGDSHLEVFDYIEKMKVLPQTIINTTIVGGATAQGAVNPNSKTNALNIFMKSLACLDRNSHVMFMLGEVDCGFVIWYRAAKHGVPVHEQLDNSLRNYFEFLSAVEAMGFRHIYVCTAHPPTIRDEQEFGEVANLRREVKATQFERTELTLEYNARIRAHCADKGYVLVDIEQEVMNSETNLVDPLYLNQDPTDHHLETKKIAPLYERQLRAAGFR